MPRFPGEYRIQSGTRKDAQIATYLSPRQLRDDGSAIWESVNDVLPCEGLGGRARPEYIAHLEGLRADCNGNISNNPLCNYPRGPADARTATLAVPSDPRNWATQEQSLARQNMRATASYDAVETAPLTDARAPGDGRSGRS